MLFNYPKSFLIVLENYVFINRDYYIVTIIFMYEEEFYSSYGLKVKKRRQGIFEKRIKIKRTTHIGNVWIISTNNCDFLYLVCVCVCAFKRMQSILRNYQ